MNARESKDMMMCFEPQSSALALLIDGAIGIIYINLYVHARHQCLERMGLVFI